MAPEVQLMQHSSTRWRTFAFTLMALGLLGASCDGGDDSEVIGAGGDSSTTSVIETTTSAPPPTTTTAVPTPEEEVLAAYHGYWAAIDEALGLPQAQPGLAALRQYGTAESLAGIIESAETLLKRGEGYRILENGLYTHRAELVSIDHNTATVRDCSIDDTVRLNVVTGEVLDEAVSTRLYIAMLVLEQGNWKVAVLDRKDAWEGVAGCAVESP